MLREDKDLVLQADLRHLGLRQKCLPLCVLLPKHLIVPKYLDRPIYNCLKCHKGDKP